MDLAIRLAELGLDEENSVVIGSGILSAVGIRDSRDVDLVVSGPDFGRMKGSGLFEPALVHGREVLKRGDWEIGTSWGVLGKDRRLADLMVDSEVLGGVRYVTLGFLLDVKRSWAAMPNPRPKDVADVRLIEAYLAGRRG